ncbi:MAG: hypothetical protein LKJ80_08440 [Oscillibacter sp.]|jgi:hypothetical protein|nr:hypothetical protein [Oscillibacter sp.]
MQQTTNLHLSQWDASDRIMREDFNRDNAAVEAAFAARPLAKLIGVTTQASAAQIDLDISKLDYTNYSTFLIVPRITLVSAVDAGQIYIRLNNAAGLYIMSGSYPERFGTCSPADRPGVGFLVLFITDQMTGLWSRGLLFGNSSASCGEINTMIGISRAQSGVPSTLNFYEKSGNTLKAGSNITVYGVRK